MSALYVVERGAGTPVLLLHGFGVDHRLLLPLDPTFAAAGGWRRLYVDLPGHGRSPLGEVVGTDDVVDAVDRLVDDRIGDASFVVVGNSWGAMTARALVHRRRDQVVGLATLAGAVVADRDRRDVPPATVLHEDPAALAVAGDAAADYAELAVVQSPDNARAFVDHVLPGLRAADPVGAARIAARYALAVDPEDAPFDRPTLFVTARQDQVVGHHDTAALLDHYPRATFAVLDAAGHNVSLDRPGLVGALLTDWLARVRDDLNRRAVPTR